MKRTALAFAFLLFAFSAAWSYDMPDYTFVPVHEKIRFKEDYYQLAADWLYADLDSVSRNIYYLEIATVMCFRPAIQALVPITNEMQYARYSNLIEMDICRLLTRYYIEYGNEYMKEHLYFFNREFYTNYTEGWAIAEKYYKDARAWWDKAVDYAKAADAIRGWRLDNDFYGRHIPWENTLERIKSGDLNYYKIVGMRLAKIDENRAKAKEMWGDPP